MNLLRLLFRRLGLFEAASMVSLMFRAEYFWGEVINTPLPHVFGSGHAHPLLE